MSDLISRDAVLKELNELWRYVNFDGDKDVFDIIMKAPAIEQGEVIFYAVEGYEEALKIHNGATLCTAKPTDLHKVPLYTTPQQPQSVADALEEFAKSIKELCSDYSSRNGSVYIGDVESAIDHLLKQHLPIKRNEDGVE